MRLFSVAGQIVTKRRNRLTTGNAVTLLVWLAGAWDEVDKHLASSKKRKAAVEEYKLCMSCYLFINFFEFSLLLVTVHNANNF